MKRSNVDVVVNGGVWNNVPQAGIISAITELAMDNIKYMSKEAMIEWLLQACEMAEETLEWKKNATLSKKINFIRDYFKEHDPSRDRIMNIMVNIILSGQGLSTLSGFGYNIGKARSRVNPEIIAMRDVKDV